VTEAGVARRIAIFSQALARLEQALRVPEDAIVRDACIQRFEFTFEMAWKAIQAHAGAQGLPCVSPRDCLRTAFRLGLVEDDPGWMAMVEDRNRTTHTYDEASARAIYVALPGHARLLATLLSRLREAASRVD
jgi:nucleotidyltransferase substrate binding protein (TIGR01987 family)